MRFAPPGNFTSLCQPTGNAHVNAAVIHQILLNGFSEGPLAIKLFPDGKRDGGLLAEPPETGWVFTPQRIFNEKRIVGGNPVAEIEAIPPGRDGYARQLIFQHDRLMHCARPVPAQRRAE